MNFLDGVSKQEFIDGEWHIHTSYTDGNNRVEEYCQLAEELNLTSLTFTEHVRKNLTYNFESLVNEIKYAQEKYPEIKIRTGCEARVLPSGELDCTDEIFTKSDYVLFAFHSFRYDKNTYLESISRVIKNFPVNAWAHPGLYSQKYGVELEDSELDEIFNLMIEYGIYLEVNFRYALPVKKWIEMFLKLSSDQFVVLGGDIHSLTDMKKSFEKKVKLKELYYSSKSSDRETLFGWIIKNYNQGD